jgi:hypothetical protein
MLTTLNPTNMDRSQLIKDYAEIIDNQIEEIRKLKGVKDKMLQEFHNIEQILGKALGYPWLKDDQKTFPLATEKDGVTVGAETAWSLAMQAADKIKELKERNEKLSKRHPTKEEALAQYHFIKSRSQRNKL